jgi:hypothetical protein
LECGRLRPLLLCCFSCFKAASSRRSPKPSAQEDVMERLRII